IRRSTEVPPSGHVRNRLRAVPQANRPAAPRSRRPRGNIQRRRPSPHPEKITRATSVGEGRRLPKTFFQGVQMSTRLDSEDRVTANSALAEMRPLAKPLHLRITRDAEGLPVIPGRYGRIEWFDGRDLAVYSDHPRLLEKLWANPGVRRWQTGDREMRALFPP